MGGTHGSPASVRFQPSDDGRLQRKAFLFQLNQTNKVSDTTLLADTDLNQTKKAR